MAAIEAALQDASLPAASHTSSMRAGGDVGTATVHMLHGTPGLPGSKQVVQGVHLGGFEAARSAVKDGRLDCANFRCVASSAPCLASHSAGCPTGDQG